MQSCRSLLLLVVGLAAASALAQTTPPSKPAPAPPQAPPAQRLEWTRAEIDAARSQCDQLLKGFSASYDQTTLLREGICGAPAPIKLKTLPDGTNGIVSFEPSPILICPLVRDLSKWLAEVVQPNAKAHLNDRVIRLIVASSYTCRFRNNDPSQKISQHAFANAIDISAFITAKGERIEVLDHWGGTDERAAFVHAVHAGACQIFGTILGPNADSAHKNHFHLDGVIRKKPLCDSYHPAAVGPDKAPAKAK